MCRMFREQLRYVLRCVRLKDMRRMQGWHVSCRVPDRVRRVVCKGIVRDRVGTDGATVRRVLRVRLCGMFRAWCLRYLRCEQVVRQNIIPDGRQKYVRR